MMRRGIRDARVTIKGLGVGRLVCIGKLAYSSVSS